MLLLRLILILLICYIAISALKSLLKGGKGKLSTRQKSTAEGEEMVFDPQQCPGNIFAARNARVFIYPARACKIFS